MTNEIRTIRLRAIGTSPLILHNGQLKDPLNKWSKLIKEISSKRKKTESDLLEMGRLEFFGGLYMGNGPNNGKIIIPPEMLTAAIKNGAKQNKLGKQFAAGVFVLDEAPLEFPDKDKDVKQLWDSGTYTYRCDVKIGTSSVMRTRPKFDTWSTEFTVTFDTRIVNEKDVVKAAEDAGALSGVGDWRPRYGRFEITKVDA
jgi:hypothetical protein